MFLVVWLSILSVIVSLTSVSGKTVRDHDQTVVCYVATWSVYRPSRGQFKLEDVDPMLCTHLIYSFLGMDDKTYTLNPLDPEYDINKGGFKKAIALKSKNPELKVSVAVGGWTEGSEKYSNMASSRISRKAFIDSAVEFLRNFNFDGLDLDWEYPANRGGRPEDKENFVLLVKELKEEFDDNDWLLTAAVSAGKSTIDTAYDIPRISMYLDYIHIMSYDYHGKWDQKTGHNAPLYHRADEPLDQQMLNVNYSVRYYLMGGAPSEKLVLGLGLYGRTFLLTNASNPGIGAPARKSAFAGPYTREDGFLGYNEICEKLYTEKSWSLAWQEAHQAPYMFRDNMWVSFDDVNSLGIKVAFAQRLGLAGVMVWSMDTDDFKGQCGSRYPLLTSINHNLALHAESRYKEKVYPTQPSVPIRPDIEDDLDKDKPGVVVDFDDSNNDLDKDKPGFAVDFEDSNNDLDNSEYRPVEGKKVDSGSSGLALSIPLFFTFVLASVLSS